MAEFIFHPETKDDISNAYTWYQQQAEGLGDDLLAELETAFEAINEYPEAWPRFTANTRRFLLSRFPFSVIYVPTPDMIHVVVIMHNSRKPGYWLDRLSRTVR